MAATTRARIEETSLSCLNKHHERCKGWHGPWGYQSNRPTIQCVCACHGSNLEAAA
jgi:hypothetical protein